MILYEPLIFNQILNISVNSWNSKRKCRIWFEFLNILLHSKPGHSTYNSHGFAIQLDLLLMYNETNVESLRQDNKTIQAIADHVCEPYE